MSIHGDRQNYSDEDDPMMDDEEKEIYPALGQLLEELRTIAKAGDYNISEAVCREKARNVLEATAGDVLTAAQLYWDDFLATRQQQQQLQDRLAVARAPNFREPNSDDNSDDEGNYSDEEDDVNNNMARLDDRAIGDHSSVDEPPPEINGDPSVAIELRRRLFDEAQLEDPDAAREERDMDLAEGLRRRLHQARNHRDKDESENEGDENPRPRIIIAGGESVSVSDDEGIFRRRSRRLTGGCEERISAKRRKLDSIQGEEVVACDEDDGYLSDNDWMWESLVSRESIPSSNPVDLLWGCAVDSQTKDTSIEKSVVPKEGGGAKDIEPQKAFAGGQIAASTMIDLDELDAGEDDESCQKLPISGIPRTWLNAGFHLAASKCKDLITAVGLTVNPPSEDDLAYFCWKHQQDNDNRHHTIPPPYHCRSLTALLSVVTGLLYTGASVQNGENVSCEFSRKPFLELIAEVNETKVNENKKTGDIKFKQYDTEPFSREFEARLVDALSALLFIAAQASAERKRKALRSLRLSKDPADQRKWQKLERKLRLVPTCWWEKDRLPELGDDGITCSIQVTTSYTNVEDLRSYVVGNFKSFTSSGGCALFLETIIRIHGKGAVARMIRRARTEAGLPHSCVDDSGTMAPLIHCTCDARHLSKFDADPKLTQKLKIETKNGIVLDTTPTGHDCLSIELLSLLLTGHVYSSLLEWSTAPLGLGIISDNPGEVGRGLTRPEKPVWILRGPTCYSVLFLNGYNEHAPTFSRVDRPGAVASLTHWNNWYGERNVSQLRLITARFKQNILTQVVDDEDAAFETEISHFATTTQMLLRRRRASQVSADQRLSIELVDRELVVTKEEMERVSVNSEDQKFYPGNHRMWRYDMGEDLLVVAEKNHKQHPQDWKTFFSLTDREKLVVETKLGPKITTVLWTRWPLATIDRFAPEDPLPIV